MTDRARDVPLLATEDLERSIPARVETLAECAGARLAVRSERHTLTYAELDGVANGIARRLLDRTEGEAPGAVALLCDHGGFAIAAILGVLKAGGFYVPLDPRHPEERNAFVLEDSQAAFLLTDGANRAVSRKLAAASPHVVRVIDVDAAASHGMDRPVTVPPHELCFLLYTSGSTGRPKGVCQVHRNVVHGALTYGRLAGLGPGDRCSLLHSVSAVASATTLFGALLNGAGVLPFDLRKHDLSGLAGWLDRESVTCFHTVPTLFRRLAPHLACRRRPAAVRLVRLGGEPVTRTDWLLFRTAFAEDSGLQVGLGSTEALNVTETIHRRSDPLDEPILPVGDPVPGKEVLLLDESGCPVGPGEVGEIAVRSRYLFPGYWRRPELTARVLSSGPGDPGRSGQLRRLFRTGDLGRRDARGRLFHVGRSDFQVKIAGHRVETAEIEHALSRVPPVREAAVVASAHRPGGARLVAFVVVPGEAALSRRGVQARLREVLPDFMVPAAFVRLDDMPLLPGGKIDRAALVARAHADRPPFVAPRNPIEETLAGLAEQTLGEPVGVDDDFFLDLGLDSLAAVELVTAASQILDRDLPLAALHEATTVAELSARLLDDGWTPPESGELALNPTGSRPPLFAVCGAFGHALRLLLVGRRLDPSQPFHALQPPAMDWERAGCRTIEEMAGYYAAAIRRRQPRGPYRLLGTSFGGVIAFEIALQLRRAGDQVALLAMVDTVPPDCEGPKGIDRAERHDWTATVDRSDPVVRMGARVADAHRAALDRYLLRERFDGTITYFRCGDDPNPGERDRRGLWVRFAAGGIRILPVPGVHGYFHREPQLSALVAGLCACLGAP